MNFLRVKQVLKYGKKDAESISKMQSVNLSKSYIFKDIIKCFFKYNIWSNEYRKEQFWQLSLEQREEIGNKYKLKRKKHEEWLNEVFAERKFLIKWSSFKYEASPKLQQRRIDAYCRRYDIGKRCFIGHDVLLERHHDLWGKIKIGNNCLLAKHTYIDYSGELIIHDNVAIANGVIIETHAHQIDKGGKALPTRLEIGDNTRIYTRAYVADTCHFIGRGARIGAGSYVRKDIPPYAVVIGNPARIVGFRFPPSVIVEYEEENYPEGERIPIEVLEDNYKKYYLSKLSEIKGYLG